MIDCVHPNILRAFPATCANFGDWAADLIDENCEPICEDLDPDCTDEVCSNTSEDLDNIIRLSRCQRTCTTDGSCPDSNGKISKKSMQSYRFTGSNIRKCKL